MAKLKLYPPSGTVDEARSLKFELTEFDSDLFRVSMENATHGTRIPVKLMQDTGNRTCMGIMDITLPGHLTQSAISIFAHIEEKQKDNTYKTIQICPTIFVVKNDVMDIQSGLSVFPSFVGPDDLCSIRLTGKPNSKKIVSINDKFFRTVITDRGMGTVSFKGRDVVGNREIESVYQLPIYLYNEEDNFTKKTFSNTYLNVLPTSLAMHTNPVDPRCDPGDTENYVTPPGSWTQPIECQGDIPPIDSPVIEPTIPPNALPATCKEDTVVINDNLTCKIFQHSATMLNSGMVLHAYLSPDVSIVDADSPAFNINKVFLAKHQSAQDVQIIANRDVVIEPKVAGEYFRIHVQHDLWVAMAGVSDTSASDIYVVLFNDAIGFQRIRIVDRVVDEYTDSEILLGEMEWDFIGISDWLFCVNAVFYHAELSPDVDLDVVTNPVNLPYVYVVDDDFLQIVNVTVASNLEYVSGNEEAYVYIIVEALYENESHLFFNSVVIGRDSGVVRDNLDQWVQLTSIGNNRNPIAKVGSDNNLHIVWESDRGGIVQVYYGILGLSLVSSAGTAFSSCLDKYSEFLSKAETPFDYLSANLLVEASGDEYSPIPQYDSESLVGSAWANYGATGAISQSAGSSYIKDVTITANAVIEDAMVFQSLQIVDDDDIVSVTDPSTDNSIPYSQFNYQVAFNLTATVTQSSSLATAYDSVVVDEKDMDNLFDTWKTEFALSYDDNVNNQTVYTKDDNNFVIGRTDNVFDRLVPIVGSYQNDSANPSADRFQIDITNQSNNLKDFTFGFMFERSVFVATNIVSSSDFSVDNPSSIAYIASETHTIYTGLAKLVVLIKTEDVENNRANYIIVREFPEKIDVTEDKNYMIIANYTAIDSAEVGNLLDTYEQTYANKFLGQVTLFIDTIPRFSQSFISTLSDDYNYFDIGLGIPDGGYYIADKMSPSKLGVFDNVEAELIFTNIEITSPTFSNNTSIISLPSNVRDMTPLRVMAPNPSGAATNLLYMGTDVNPNSLIQVPITFEGINQSPDIALGTCNDVHCGWQSNRDRYWDIFYSNSVNKLSPFRFNTQITDTESNSLRPSLSINRNGTRMITWHDNRNGNFDIFMARSTDGYACDQNKCSKEQAEAFADSIIECSVSLEYAAIVGVYALSLEFYKDAALSDLYKTISINKDTFTRWFIDNSSVSSILSYNDDGIEGVVFSSSGTVTVSYMPGKDDDIFDKVLYVKLASVEVE